MIRQKPTKTITGAYTITDADNGYRIICNSATNFVITMHSPTGRYNFDLEIDNKGAGIVTVGGKELAQDTHAHVGNNNGTEWVVSIGGGGSSGGASSFIDLLDVPSSYTGQAGKVPVVKSTENGLEFVSVQSSVIKILDLYATLADLQTAHPIGTAGDAYAVGNSTDNEIYIWSATNNEWVSIGSITQRGESITPTGDGTEDTYDLSLTASGSTYSGHFIFIEMKVDTWVSAFKLFVFTANTTAELEVRTIGGEPILLRSGIEMIAGQFNTVYLDEPILLKAKGYYCIGFKYNVNQKSYRRSSYAYDGTLWKLLHVRINDFFGTSYVESPGFGIIEYMDSV